MRKLRRIAGKAQADIATALKIKQPSVSKIEKQADMYLSTLRVMSKRSAVSWNLWLSFRNVQLCVFSTSAMRLNAQRGG